MKIALSDLGTEDTFDYCIIGAGPAGISCALPLAKAGKKVAVLEAGGLEYTEWSQGIYKGEVIGDHYYDLDAARLRYFGGTSNHWGGWCRTLDPIDFEDKPYFKDTAWPINKKDLDPYIKESNDILELKDIIPDSDIGKSGFKQVDWVVSPPVNMGEKYKEPFAKDKNISLILDANLVGFETNGTAISGAVVADPKNNRVTVKAKEYILAAGGIENSRLLLWANEETNGQIVKNSTTLGKYWMEHPVYGIGSVITTGKFDRPHKDLYGQDHIFVAPTDATMKKMKTLNCAFIMVKKEYKGTKKLIADIGCVAPEWASWAAWQFGETLSCGYHIRAGWEQQPLASNRIELDASKKDALGMPRTKLFWKKSEADMLTLRKTAQSYGAYLARSNTGRMKLNPWVLGEGDPPKDEEIAGYHHMGGTRMADSAEQGIVDANCKVFGQDNLYIAGSSVFPSGGYANPTLTIVQLALRLSEHLLAKA